MARAGHLLGSSRLERFQDERRLLGVFVPLAVAHLRSFAIAKLMLNPACRSFLRPCRLPFCSTITMRDILLSIALRDVPYPRSNGHGRPRMHPSI